MSVTQRELARQHDLGAQAARGERKPWQAPVFGFSADELLKEDAWWDGYQSVKPNAERPIR